MRPEVVDERDVQQEVVAESLRVWAMTDEGRATVYEARGSSVDEVIAWAAAQPFTEWSLAAMVRYPDGLCAVWLKGRDPSDGYPGAN